MKSGYLCKLEPSFQFSNSAMEGVTKWDPVRLKTSDEVRQIYSNIKHIDQQVSAVSMVAGLETDLEQARARIQELETDRRSSKKKLEHFLKKVSEERAAWQSSEHEKIRAFIDGLKAECSLERKNRQIIEIMNSKLVNELADAKCTAKRYMQDYDKERKARELIEEVCDELAKEIGEDKAEVEALKRESMKLREEFGGLHCFRWGLQNHSGFGQSIRASKDAWENIFVISIVIYGMMLFVFFIGNMQIYLQSQTNRSEMKRQKKQEIEQSKSFEKLPEKLQKQIKRYQPEKREATEVRKWCCVWKFIQQSS